MTPSGAEGCAGDRGHDQEQTLLSTALGGSGEEEPTQAKHSLEHAWLSQQHSCRAVSEGQAAEESDLSFWTAFGTTEPQQSSPSSPAHNKHGKAALSSTLRCIDRELSKLPLTHVFPLQLLLFQAPGRLQAPTANQGDFGVAPAAPPRHHRHSHLL